MSYRWKMIVTDTGRTESSMEAAHCLKRKQCETHFIVLVNIIYHYQVWWNIWRGLIFITDWAQKLCIWEIIMIPHTTNWGTFLPHCTIHLLADKGVRDFQKITLPPELAPTWNWCLQCYGPFINPVKTANLRNTNFPLEHSGKIFWSIH